MTHSLADIASHNVLERTRDNTRCVVADIVVFTRI